MCVYVIFLQGQSPTKGENQKVRISKTSREGDTAKPGPVAGLQLFTRLPKSNGHYLQMSAHTSSPFNFSCKLQKVSPFLYISHQR